MRRYFCFCLSSYLRICVRISKLTSNLLHSANDLLLFDIDSRAVYCVCQLCIANFFFRTQNVDFFSFLHSIPSHNPINCNKSSKFMWFISISSNSFVQHWKFSVCRACATVKCIFVYLLFRAYQNASRF